MTELERGPGARISSASASASASTASDSSGSTNPGLLVAVVGTATEVGKTWVTAHLLEGLRARGLTVSVRKPLQSYDPASDEPTDAEVLSAASGESPQVVCASTRSLPVAMAPPMAAAVLGLSIPTVAELVSEIRWSAGIDIGVVETVGGVRSPLAADGDSRALVLALEPDAVVLVADAALGVINSVRTSVDALAPLAVAVYLNRYDPDDDLHRRNREWLTERDGFNVVVGIDDLVEQLVGYRGRATGV